MKIQSTVLGVAAALLCAVADNGSTNASPITSLSGGTVLNFPAVNLNTPGPETVASGVTWTSTESDAFYGYTSLPDNFSTNGYWNGSPPYVGMDEDDQSMQFAFSTPVSAVGGIVDWYIFPDTGGYYPASMSVYNSSDVLIETLQLYDNSTNANLVTPDAFHGFQESTADISYFVLAGDYAGIQDLAFVSSASTCGDLSPAACAATPLPSTWTMMLLGLAGLFLTYSGTKKASSAIAAA
jgi:hypothetical protein